MQLWAADDPGLDDSSVIGREGTRGTSHPWVGILPDGVSDLRAVLGDGTELAVPVNSDGAFAFEPAKAVTAFTWTDSHGHAQSWPITGPPHS